jgi:hypothetical protein
MFPGSGSARRFARIAVSALFFAALSFLFSSNVRAAEPPATFTRFCASCGLRDIETFSSQSRQFIVHGSIVPRRYIPAAGTNSAAFTQLEPQLVAVTAERIRFALTRELGLRDAFRDKVHVIVQDWAPAEQRIGIVSQMHTDGFVYKMVMPGRVKGVQFVKGLVQVLLLELANRDVARCAELPTWLVEGMTRQMLTRIVPATVLNRDPLTIERAGYDRLGGSKTFLKTNTPVTIQELSFADLSKSSAEQLAQYEASSHLLVHQLLQLKGGPQLMTRFIQSLPRTLNWQTAQFHVYKEHFDSPLALEKWWLLNWAQFRSREEREAWSVPVTLDRLDSILHTPMEVRTDTNNIPHQRDASLQELIQLAEFAVQKDLLAQKLQHMAFMSLSVATPAVPLWSAYQRAIESYLQKRNVNEYQPGLKSDPEQRLQALIKATLKSLDELDFARGELRAGRIPVLPKDLSRQASR